MANDSPRGAESPLHASLCDLTGESVWQRYEQQQPQCGYGRLGVCCKICFMGPCIVNPFGEEPQYGVCGAPADTIAARNFIRMIAAGAAAHSDHGRDVAHTLLLAARKEAPGYEIQDEKKLHAVAKVLEVPTDGRDKYQIAEDVAQLCLADFGRQDEGELLFTRYAPEATRERWRKAGIMPRSIDREIVEIMHRTHMGVDQDYHSLMLQGSRAALADGWGGSMIATELQDILFGTPQPIRAEADLGVLEKDQVNIVVHGHEPILSEMLVLVSQEPEMLKLAEEQGAKGINLGGICCTANEILMRHGIPVVGNFLQQELALATGAVEAMIVDVQCIMPAVVRESDCFHTELITTSPKGHIPGATHIEFSEAHALETAREIIKRAVMNFKHRGKEVNIPKGRRTEMIAGFTTESIKYMLGGSFRGSYRPLNDNIMNGRVRGAVGVVGCNNPKISLDTGHLDLVRELIARDVLVVQTGCSALACGKAGLLTPETARNHAGPGLAEVCETVGIPPVLHMGSCVDNSRILAVLAEMVHEGGLGNDIADLPVAGAAPEWMSEKAISIGEYVVASGVYTLFGVGLPVLGAKNFARYIFEEYAETRGATWAVEPDPKKAADLICAQIEKKRDALGINEEKERVLFDMEARRQLEV